MDVLVLGFALEDFVPLRSAAAVEPPQKAATISRQKCGVLTAPRIGRHRERREPREADVTPHRHRTARDGRRYAMVLSAAAAVALLSSCALLPTSSVVFDTGLEPVPLDFTGPTYAAAVPAGLLLRSGDTQWVLPEADHGRWLPGAVALVDRSPRSIDLHVLDMAGGAPAPGGAMGAGVRVPGFDLPGRSVTQVNVLNALASPAVLTAYTPQLEKLWSLRLPETDNPEATRSNELARNYYNVAPTIDGATFVQWHDGSEWYEDGDYGVARVKDGMVTNVLLNERIVALYLSADGTGLLASRQKNGDPCGGCVVDQEIVEIDPATGEIAGAYGMPEQYVEGWRVGAIDKVGDRVAVRFTETAWSEDPADEDDAAPVTVQRGTWVYDGDWSMVEGSEDELTWWQGTDRVVARPAPAEPVTGDGLRLFWVHDGTATPLPGELEGSLGRRYITGSVPGQLVPAQ